MILCFMTSGMLQNQIYVMQETSPQLSSWKSLAIKPWVCSSGYNLVDEKDLKGMKWIDSESESNNEDIGAKIKCLDIRMMDTYMDT